MSENLIVNENKSPKKTRKKRAGKNEPAAKKASPLRVTVLNKELEVDVNLNSNISSGLYSLMQNAFDSRKYVSGMIYLLLKDALLALLIAHFLYVVLNINAFSFQRLTFSDAANLWFILMALFLLQDIVTIISVLLINKYYNYQVRWRRTIASMGKGELLVILIIIVSLLYFKIFNNLPYFLLVLAFVVHLTVIFKVISLSSIMDENKKMLITIITITLNLFLLWLFFPLLSKNLIRIIEIMF